MTEVGTGGGGEGEGVAKKKKKKKKRRKQRGAKPHPLERKPHPQEILQVFYCHCAGIASCLVGEGTNFNAC